MGSPDLGELGGGRCSRRPQLYRVAPCESRSELTSLGHLSVPTGPPCITYTAFGGRFTGSARLAFDNPGNWHMKRDYTEEALLAGPT